MRAQSVFITSVFGSPYSPKTVWAYTFCSGSIIADCCEVAVVPEEELEEELDDEPELEELDDELDDDTLVVPFELLLLPLADPEELEPES